MCVYIKLPLQKMQISENRVISLHALNISLLSKKEEILLEMDGNSENYF